MQPYVEHYSKSIAFHLKFTYFMFMSYNEINLEKDQRKLYFLEFFILLMFSSEHLVVKLGKIQFYRKTFEIKSTFWNFIQVAKLFN